MYNSDIPIRAELPSTAQLIKSTVIAIVAAIVILVTIVLPAEYAIDPTGVGKMLKLTEMGEIKAQLAKEAEADRIKDRELPQQPKDQAPGQRSGLLDAMFAKFLIGPAAASDRSVLIAQAPASRTDETVITLKPTEGVEYKMELPRGAQVQFEWRVEGGVVNYDMHGTPGDGKEKSYKAARGVSGDKGVLTADFDGTHGWFFRNRGSLPVTIKLMTAGAYKEIKKVM
jgi:hypothetical protein